MNEQIGDREQTDMEILRNDVPDEAVEASAGQDAGPRVVYSLQFYTCGGGTCP